MLHDRGAILALAERLAEVPKTSQERMTTLEAIEAIAPQVRAWRAEGHDWERVREELEKGGLRISTATLVTYFKKVAAGGRKRRRPRGERLAARSRAETGGEGRSGPDGEGNGDPKGEKQSDAAGHGPDEKPPEKAGSAPGLEGREGNGEVGGGKAGEGALGKGGRKREALGASRDESSGEGEREGEGDGRREWELARAGFPRPVKLEDL